MHPINIDEGWEDDGTTPVVNVLAEAYFAHERETLPYLPAEEIELGIATLDDEPTPGVPR